MHTPGAQVSKSMHPGAKTCKQFRTLSSDGRQIEAMHILELIYSLHAEFVPEHTRFVP